MKKWRVIAASVLTIAMIGSSSASCLAATKSKANAASVFDYDVVNELVNDIESEKICVDFKSKVNTKLAASTKSVKTAARIASSGGSSGTGTVKSGTYPTRKGMILVTGDYYKNLLPTGHAAIVYSSTKVVESLSSGVVVGRNDWYNTRKTCYAGSVSSTTAAQDAKVADWCYGKIGKPYNYNYFNTSTRSKFYCSQLVYAGFLDVLGIDLNTSDFKVPGIGNPVHPLELLDNNYTYITYRQE